MKSIITHFLSAFAFFFITMSSPGQTVIYHQAFEDTANLFNSYVLYEGDHGIPASTSMSSLADSAWVVRSVPGLNTHAAVATSDYNPDVQANDWFITPAIQLGKDSKLRFKASALQSNPADIYTVYISTSQQDVNSCLFNAPLATFEGEKAGEWTEHTISLADAGFASQQVYLGFRLHTLNGGNNLFIDDISVLDDSATSLVSLTFSVNMGVWMKEGKFYPSMDSIDIVGNFNNWTSGEYLLDMQPPNDSVYSITIPGFYVGQHLEFKFRINCSWADTLVEFPYGQPNRVWNIEQGKYTYSCYYNDEGITYGIKEREKLMKSVKAFPNPVTDVLSVIIPSEIERISVMDMNGKRVAELHTGTAEILKLNLTGFHNGNYLILFYAENGFVGSRKIVKR